MENWEWRIENCELRVRGIGLRLRVKGESGELGVRVGMICNFNRWFLLLNIIVI
jgi:hypothetical protein